MTTTPIQAHELPTTVRAYLAAHAAGETDAATRTFAPDVVVTDQGHTYRGRDEVRDFLAAAGGEYTYTTELVGAERDDDDPTRWVAVQRLEGDFPGGVADLRYRFTLVDDLVAELHIAP
ncbi:hypothetical protein GCM10009737_33060 [Nocardioides lentus]|uniref:SnoaL-like domain-containing protein n=1 Tax=Nocardioides lentus TaxID=338077 RepID=A0ABN2PQQ9_9ACTN